MILPRTCAPLASALLLAAVGAAQNQGIPPEALQLQSPAKMAVAPTGLLVTDHAGKAVLTIEPTSRRPVRRFAVDGFPTAIGYRDGRVFVGNETTARIEVYSLRGELLGVLGGAGTVVERARDIAIDAEHELLFALDGGAGHVKVFDLTVQPMGQLVQTIGQPGSLLSDFQNPTALAVDPGAEEVYVADYGKLGGSNIRILVLDYTGAFVEYIPSDGGATAYFWKPQGVELGPSGHVFVVDAWYGQVVVMDRATKTRIGTLGGYGSGPGELKLPLDLVITGADHDVYVTDNRNARVQAFPKGGQL